jgi:hypothetical protein
MVHRAFVMMECATSAQTKLANYAIALSGLESCRSGKE